MGKDNFRMSSGSFYIASFFFFVLFFFQETCCLFIYSFCSSISCYREKESRTGKVYYNSPIKQALEAVMSIAFIAVFISFEMFSFLLSVLHLSDSYKTDSFNFMGGVVWEYFSGCEPTPPNKVNVNDVEYKGASYVCVWLVWGLVDCSFWNKCFSLCRVLCLAGGSTNPANA